MALSFAPFAYDSDDAKAFRQLFKHDSIFEPQRRDGDDRHAVDLATFAGAYLAVAWEGTVIDEAVGYILYTPRPNGVFEQHTGFLPEHRGLAAEEYIGNATLSMFMETLCSQIVTFCPEWLPSTRAMAKRMGAIRLFDTPRFAFRDGKPYSATLFGQTALQWAWRIHHEFEEVGAHWHDQVFAAIEPHHEEDPSHNGFLGLALEMGKRQPHKAMAIYSAWAELAGYEPGRLVWADGEGNSFIDIGNAMVLNGPDRILAVIPRCPPQPRLQPPPEPSPAQV